MLANALYCHLLNEAYMTVLFKFVPCTTSYFLFSKLAFFNFFFISWQFLTLNTLYLFQILS